MDPFRSFAESLALGAGDILRRHQGQPLHIEYKGTIDLVTEVDRESEAYLRARIAEAYPDHQILGEEEGLAGAESPFRWLVDPVDGTTNYAHGFPYYCVSVGLEFEGRIIAGAVYNPCLDELFSADLGGGATCNGRPIQVSDIDELRRSLLTTGFPYSVIEEGNNLPHFARFLHQCQAVRRAGSAALDMCNVACGRYDGFWEYGLSPWDMAGGSIILTEAGGRISDYQGRPFNLYGKELLASNGPMHGPMMDVLREP
jgi:myo-inositol-1(or 4)-monophosphatase